MSLGRKKKKKIIYLGSYQKDELYYTSYGGSSGVATKRKKQKTERVQRTACRGGSRTSMDIGVKGWGGDT